VVIAPVSVLAGVAQVYASEERWFYSLGNSTEIRLYSDRGIPWKLKERRRLPVWSVNDDRVSGSDGCVAALLGSTHRFQIRGYLGEDVTADNYL
jgi:hypothetical protein